MGITLNLSIIFIAAIVSFSVHADEKSKDSLPMTQSYSQKNLLKNWALSACLATIAKDEQSKKDASITASAYMEFGHQPIEIYHKIGELVEQYAARKYSGSVPSEYNTMKCIDLFHSKELDEMTSRYSKMK